ncbi:hypothetical protein N7462_003933 [Penicillium macrosclerotiorum]|uniref:uncharacterized protein n=1 Tax=Penicillium macrosclerotiorum TaxID=303699 RepID=UPI002547152D|nr:uncharacterized protein N7462_003933 [Penicillium macrosclerotiorum]KAJ5689541.1 hypothetical protein N7462_003933 [Penicillium macrosclerotiorum]
MFSNTPEATCILVRRLIEAGLVYPASEREMTYRAVRDTLWRDTSQLITMTSLSVSLARLEISPRGA